MGAATFVAWWLIGTYFRLAPVALAIQLARVCLMPVEARLRQADVDQAARIAAAYHVGLSPVPTESPRASWQALAQRIPELRVLSSDAALQDVRDDIPFVYQDASADYLQEFKRRYHLEKIVAQSDNEYESMLKLGAWVGTRWDHGSDLLPNDHNVCNPSAVIENGSRGATYWCEIAARTLVHAASALGWPARLITASRDGYTWEHAVAELWSNRFDKWFVIDADFNMVYEDSTSRVPLSAFELHTTGEQLQRSGRLVLRSIAPPKKGLRFRSLIPFYAYVHVDMRNDWCTRALPRGSPAGGDLATWWTARPSVGPILTAKVRVDDHARFDWPLNTVALYALNAERIDGERVLVKVGLAGYSPVFARFELSIDGRSWQPVEGSTESVIVTPATHSIQGRIVTRSGDEGPVSELKLSLVKALQP